MLNTATPGNFYNLTEGQQDYFRNLASGDPNRTPLQFFQDTVPVELQDKPELLEVFLNGGTVTTPEFTFTRGRNGGEFELVEHELPDRDWSHDVSRANGGSDSADNGRFEDASVNRSRGAANTTPSEQAAADAATEADVEVLTDSLSAADVERAADLTLVAEGTEVLGVVTDVALDFVAPLVGGAAVAKLAADQFESTEAKVAAGTAGGVGTALLLCTPVGQVGLGCYLGYKLVRGVGRFFANA